MKTPAQIAQQIRQVHFGGNWAAPSLKEQLKDLTWKQATAQLYSLNAIVTLVYHMNYYVKAVSEVLEGKPLNAKDKYSFDHPPIKSEKDWQQVLDIAWTDAEKFADLVEELAEEKLWEEFHDKYGNYYRNIHGVIEHIHYHLGQIALIKKILAKNG